MAAQVNIQWTAETILDCLRDHAAELRAMGVTKIGLFGSYARGDQKPDSDIDFLLTMDKLTWRGWMDVWNFLEDSFGVEVDLVPEKDLRPELRPRVLAEARYMSCTYATSSRPLDVFNNPLPILMKVDSVKTPKRPTAFCLT